MCKACKMDAGEYRQHEQRKGALDPEDFEAEVNYRPKKKKKASKRPGCPENEGKAHIYIWTSEYNWDNIFSDYFGYHRSEKKICAGCGKKSGSTRDTARYEEEKKRRWKTGKTRYAVYKYWFWENDDEGYREFRRKYIARHGWDRRSATWLWN